MADAAALDGPRQEPVGEGPARGLVLLLHGLGADGNDLLPLAPVLQQVLPDVAFVSPHAPQPCDMAPQGRQWFSFQDLGPDALMSGVLDAAPLLDAFIDAERDRYGVPDDRIALLGFSQGAMMSLHVGLRRKQRLAAILGYSGLLVAPERLQGELRSRPPVLLVHGEADEVVPFQAMAAAEQALRANQIPVQSEARPGLGHGIDEAGIRLAAGLLMAAFDPEPAQDAR